MDLKTLSRYEAMAKLQLPEKERAWILGKAVLLTQSFAALFTINTDNTEALVTPLDTYNPLREDKAEKLLSRDEILANAPEQFDGYFQSPATLE